MYTKVDRPSVEKMVRSFYALLVKDDLVGPFFIKKLGDDLKNERWLDHYKTLDSFWLLMMTGELGYAGDPFFPHVGLGELTPEIFQRWLDVFDAHIRSLFIPEIADKFYKKSETLADSFMQGLEVGKYAEDDD